MTPVRNESAMHRLFEITADCNKTLGSLQTAFLSFIKEGFTEFLAKTNDVTGYMNTDGWIGIGFAVGGAFFTFVEAAIPNGANAASSAASNPRLGANDGIGDMISKFFNEKLKDSDFWKSTSKGTAQLCNSAGSPVHMIFQCQITGIEAKIKLIEVGFREGQQNNAWGEGTRDKLINSIQSIIQAENKGW